VGHQPTRGRVHNVSRVSHDFGCSLNGIPRSATFAVLKTQDSPISGRRRQHFLFASHVYEEYLPFWSILLRTFSRATGVRRSEMGCF
jgi:hypothetical protein